MNELNVKPRIIFCRDNLEILRGINDKCIDLIYLDPPFNKKKVFSAPLGSSAEGAEFSDIFREEDIKDEWVKSIEFENPALHSYLMGVKTFSNIYNYCYLVYMAVRLLECHRILRDTGSIYLHCDPTMSHYLKIVMDCIFSENNFRNEIIWCYTGPSSSKRWFPRKHDVIFWFSAGNAWTFHEDKMRIPYVKLDTGRTSGIFKKAATLDSRGKVPEDWWSHFSPVGRLQSERTGYPTQKPLALLERIISASSNKGDVVLDPFCGCATTCVAAERLDRQWIGVDVSIKAFEIVKKRLGKEVPPNLFRGEPVCTTVPPVLGESQHKKKGSVYVISNSAWKGKYKVGISKNVAARLMSYQTSDPHRGYKLEHSIDTPYYAEIEKHIHEVFDNENEWVSAKLKDLKRAMEKWQQDED